MRYLFFILTFLSLTSWSMTFGQGQQSSGIKFVQFTIVEDFTNYQAQQIDNVMSSFNEIDISRTDYITKSYYCVFHQGMELSKEAFELKFQAMGYTISCFYKGIRGVDPIKSPHTVKNCN